MESFRCYDNSDVIATLVMTIFPNVCLWRRSLCSDLVLTLKNCIEPPSYARTAYVVAIWPSFLFDSFVKIWATCEMFLGKWFTAPLGKKFPVRLWEYSSKIVTFMRKCCDVLVTHSRSTILETLVWKWRTSGAWARTKEAKYNISRADRNVQKSVLTRIPIAIQANLSPGGVTWVNLCCHGQVPLPS